MYYLLKGKIFIMTTNLLEKYQKRVAVAESLYKKNMNGANMPSEKKVALVRCLENVNSFLTEAFDNSVGTQRSDMGLYKKFALTLTNVAVPTLISYDLVMVYPMSSMSGYCAYLNFVAGSNKGTVKQGDVFNGFFGMPQENNSNAQYTSSTVTVAGTGDGTSTKEIKLDWISVVEGSVKIVAVKGDVGGATTTTYYVDDGAGKLYKADALTGYAQSITTLADGRVVANVTLPTGATEVGTVDYKTGTIALGEVSSTQQYFDGNLTTTYVYNNIYIPQNDLPLLNAKMDGIPLIAKARRIAVYYSQIAEYQAKTDYGFDMAGELAKQAAGQLQFEVDSEVVQLLAKTAKENVTDEEKALLTWSKTIPVGVSLAEHYEGFAEKIGYAGTILYNRTKRYAATWMVIAADVLPVMSFLKGFTAAPASNINGPYLAGTYNGLKVFVSPALDSGEYVIGVLNNAAKVAAAVYAPYLPVIPTQLLGHADGGMSQGFSTMYALEVLNPKLVVAGKIDGIGAQQYIVGDNANPVFTKSAT